MATESDLGSWFHGFLAEEAFLAKYPYYVAVLAKLSPVADPSVARMAVSFFSGRFYLHINVEAFQREPQYLRGVLLHEVHHIVLGHLTHPKFAEGTEPELMDLALEMSANEYIDEPLPPAITWQAYASVGLRAGQSTLERYEKLMDALRASGKRPRPAPGTAPTEPRLDDHRFLRRGDQIPGALHPTKELLEGALREVKGPPVRGEKLPPPAFRLAGKDPGRLLEELLETLRAPSDYIDWKAALQRFATRARAPMHTYGRPSRRFPSALGQYPGRLYVSRVAIRPSLVVAIDTSLSMLRPELEEVARQLVVLAGYARLTVVECDVEITRVYPFEGALTRVMGRGGTDLRPVFRRDFLASLKADGVIYFTDGDGPTPEIPPPVPTLWVLTKPHTFACPWGERAWLGRNPHPKPLPPAPPAPPPPKRSARKSTKG